MDSHIDIWSLMRTLAYCNGEGCHSHLPNCPDYADCKVDSDRILEFIETLIEQREKPMVEALIKAKIHIESAERRNGIDLYEQLYQAKKTIDAVLPKG